MGNYIADNRNAFSERHYVRKASTKDYWFDFTANRVKSYQQQYGSDFCLIIYGSALSDDAYIMPYNNVSSLFSDRFLDARGRWIGNIRNNIIVLTPGGRSLSVSAYYNAFHLLDVTDHPTPRAIHDPGSSYNVGGADDPDELKQKIQAFNEQFRTTIPHKRRSISEQVARPGAVTDYLKALCKYTCQLCNESGFLQANGTQYVEAHHIIELHKLIPGSYCSDNIIVVCPTCHRKLHFASVTYATIDNTTAQVTINGKVYKFTRFLLSNEAGA
jgi:hypothetical protein